MLACAFEGTNVSVGRGTENNFKFTAPYLPKAILALSQNQIWSTKSSLQWNNLFWRRFVLTTEIHQLELKWLIKAYNNTTDKSKF
jgi:uncharacterized protein YbbC (DUF1343 family)